MSARRLSLGGQVVLDSLAAVSFSDTSQAVTLVETAQPQWRRFEVVLAQNAWCVTTRDQFRDLVRPYPHRMKARHLARRAVAGVNLRRAVHTIALSAAMAEMMASRGLRPLVCPVTVPMDYLQDCLPISRPTWVAGDLPFVVVPGSVTWYKNSEWVIDFVRQFERTSVRVPHVVLAGGDDGSGCLQQIQRELGVAVSQGVVSRAEMQWLLANANAVIIPSRLESLSFSLSEALLSARDVVASPLEVHREVAARVGIQPLWLDAPHIMDELFDRIHSPMAVQMPQPDLQVFIDEWRNLSDEIVWLADD